MTLCMDSLLGTYTHTATAESLTYLISLLPYLPMDHLIHHTSEANDFPLKIEGAKGTPRFLGYRLVEGYPKFRYSQGKHMITELIQMNDEKTGIRRTFTISPPSRTVLKLSPTTLASTSSDRGIMKKDGTLNLSSSESAEFSVFIIPNEETN